MENPFNRIVAVGRIPEKLTRSHEVMNEPFYTGTLVVKRLSGAEDALPITVPGKLVDPTDLPQDALLMVTGQVRSYNKIISGSGRLMVTLFAQSIEQTRENETLNKITLIGALCKPPVYRSTPFGREICDMMLAVNRSFGKSDYIPSIAWGRNAQYASRLHVGDRVKLTGRLQSREYQKLMENGEYMTRNAYEVSAFTIDIVEAQEPISDASPTPIRPEPIEFSPPDNRLSRAHTTPVRFERPTVHPDQHTTAAFSPSKYALDIDSFFND